MFKFVLKIIVFSLLPTLFYELEPAMSRFIYNLNRKSRVARQLAYIREHRRFQPGALTKVM